MRNMPKLPIVKGRVNATKTGFNNTLIRAITMAIVIPVSSLGSPMWTPFFNNQAEKMMEKVMNKKEDKV